MKNRQVVELLEVFTNITKSRKYDGVEFGYFVIKNKRSFEKQVEILNELVSPLEKFSEFEQKRVALLTECATNEEGKVQTQDLGQGKAQYLLQEDKKEKFVKEIGELQNEYKEVIEKQTQKYKEYEDLLDRETDIEIKKIHKKSIPSNIEISDLEAMFDLIED